MDLHGIKQAPMAVILTWTLNLQIKLRDSKRSLCNKPGYHPCNLIISSWDNPQLEVAHPPMMTASPFALRVAQLGWCDATHTSTLFLIACSVKLELYWSTFVYWQLCSCKSDCLALWGAATGNWSSSSRLVWVCLMGSASFSFLTKLWCRLAA